MEIGVSSYNSFDNNRRTNLANSNWGLKEGSNIYRVLPPFGSLASTGQWSKFEVLHWGYCLSNGKQRVFRCIRKYDPKRKVVTANCPQCDKIEEQLGLEDNQRFKLLEQGKSKDEVKNLLQHFSDWKRKYNTDKKHYLNVRRPDGQIGKLKISNKAMKALRAEIKRLRDSTEEMDPVGRSNGVWFDFYRIGMDRESDYKVTAVYENVEVSGPNGKPMKARVLKPAPITDEIIAQFEKDGFDLGEGYKDLSRDEIQILVESDGDAETVDSVFGAPRVFEAQTKEDTTESDYNDAEGEESPAPEQNENELLAQLQAIQAKKSKTGGPSSAEDFLKTYGKK